MNASEETAFTEFGDAWVRVRRIEDAIHRGDGPSFVYANAIAELNRTSEKLRETIVREAQPFEAITTIAKSARDYATEDYSAAELRERLGWLADELERLIPAPQEAPL